MPADGDLFAQLPSFTNYAELADDRHYTCVPSDWIVVVADIVGSTQELAAGRYRDVNTIGAACIAVAQNAAGATALPYVFGGDGATLVLPPAQREAVLAALLGLQHQADERFDLRLRIGSLEVAEVESAGSCIEVARFELTAGKCIALFRGGGLTEAEQRIKDDPQRYAPDVAAGSCSFEGLSCRWNRIPSRRGTLLSLLIYAEPQRQATVYAELLADFSRLLDGGVDAANPVDLRRTNYKTVRACVADERRYHNSVFSVGFLLRLLEIIAAVLVFRFRVPPLVFDAWGYADSMRAHSDYRKLDDTMRMVIDCTEQQAAEIRDLLATRHAEGRLCYGIHASQHALMTCLVEQPRDGLHIHFVDGDDGGYAMAARQLKQQLAEWTADKSRSG